MPQFSPDAMGRIQRVVPIVERMPRNVRSHRGRWHGGRASDRHFELKDDLTPNGTATAYKLQWDDIANEWERIDTDPPAEATVRDVLGTTRGAGADDAASPDPLPGTIVRARQVGDEWHIVSAQPWPLRVRGALTGDLASETSTFRIKNVHVVAPIGSIAIAHLLDALDELADVHNIYGWEGNENGIVGAEWNEHEPRWEAYQVQCPA